MMKATVFVMLVVVYLWDDGFKVALLVLALQDWASDARV